VSQLSLYTRIPVGVLNLVEGYLLTNFETSSHKRVEAAFEETLKDLNVDYLDLYLMHYPVGGGSDRDGHEGPFVFDYLEVCTCTVVVSWPKSRQLTEINARHGRRCPPFWRLEKSDTSESPISHLASFLIC
jgi:hypothetical protein